MALRLAALMIAAGLSASERPSAPDFQLTSSRGAAARLSEMRGKIVVLNFWATWCGPCRSEIASLNAIHREYGPLGVAVVGIAMDARGWPAVLPFATQHRIEYDVLLATPAVARAYSVQALPRTVFLDRDGRIVAVHDAVLDVATLRKTLHLLLSNP